MENSPTTPNLKILFVLALIAIIVFSALFYFKNSGFRRTKPSPTQIPKNTLTPSLKPSDVLNVLLKGTKLNFPKVSSSSTVTREKLPKELDPLILQDSTNYNSKLLKYVNGKSGYQIIFDDSRSVSDIFFSYDRLITGLKGWTMIYLVKTNNAGVIEATIPNYQIKIDIVEGEKNITSVTIQTIAR